MWPSLDKIRIPSNGGKTCAYVPKSASNQAYQLRGNIQPPLQHISFANSEFLAANLAKTTCFPFCSSHAKLQKYNARYTTGYDTKYNARYDMRIIQRTMQGTTQGMAHCRTPMK